MGSDRVRVLLRLGLLGGPAEQSAQHAFRAWCGFYVWLDEPAGYLRSAAQLLLRREPIDAFGHHA